MKIRPLIERLTRIGGRLHVNQPLLNFFRATALVQLETYKRTRGKTESDTDSRKDSAQSTVEWMPPPPQKKISVQSSEVRIAGKYFQLILWGFKTKILATRN